MKIALILPNNLWCSPYVKIYSNFFDNLGIEYDIISWNRNGVEEDAIQFNYKTTSRNPLVLLWGHLQFTRFIKKILYRNKYDKLVIFTSQTAVFLSRYLKIKYQNKYIIDYRDLSIEQNRFFKPLFICALNNSYANIISSPGFRYYLPSKFEYLISHNFNVSLVKRAIAGEYDHYINTDVNHIDILTIGGIRDYESNVQIIKNLSNIHGFFVRFVGRGPSAGDLQNYAESIGSQNIVFSGYYSKDSEINYIEEASFINIFYPRKPSHDTAISNRFYNSLIFKKPMITTANTTQGDFAKEYKVGLSLIDCENLSSKLIEFMSNLDTKMYVKSCNNLLKLFLKDNDLWEARLRSFVK